MQTNIELGVIRVAEDHAKKITIYKGKEIIGEITINLNCPQTEEKIINLLSIIHEK